MNTSTLDASTLANRRELQRDLAALKLVGKRLDELIAEIQRVERSKETAAEQHQASVQPIQEKLSGIESQIVDCFATQKEPPAKLYSSREQLLGQLTTENDSLEAAIAAADTKLRKLRADRDATSIQLAERGAIEARIRQTAPQEIRDRLQVVASGLRWAQSRAKSAGKKLGELETSLAEAKRSGDKRLIEAYAERVRQWQGELDDARADISGRQAEQNELLRRALEE